MPFETAGILEWKIPLISLNSRTYTFYYAHLFSISFTTQTHTHTHTNTAIHTPTLSQKLPNRERVQQKK